MLEINGLSVRFKTRHGIVGAVNGVSLTLEKGRILGIVGESGSGKSTVLNAILRLLPEKGVFLEGEILYGGVNLFNVSPAKMRDVRGREVSMIFQDPMTTLNPVYTVGSQITESLRVHGFCRGREKERALELMREVGIPSPESRYREYPHQFSGGMQQRALIAIALACEPKLLLADEPTTALDVTIQAQIIDLLRKINRTHHTSIILVTHNLPLAAELCDEIAVMYAGRIVEKGPAEVILQGPRHPYTMGLLNAVPLPGKNHGARLATIPGTVPDLSDPPPGCVFHPRCPQAGGECARIAPGPAGAGSRHILWCLKAEKEGEGRHEPAGS
ncbi:MAG: ABC transporter ATP-binding protein [Bacillota bacterium]